MTAHPSIFTPERGQLLGRIGKKWSQYSPDVLPAWVADMDFRPMPSIRETILQALDIGDLGYPPVSGRSGIPESFAQWAKRRWDWSVDPQHVQLVPDVVGGIDNCIEVLTDSGEGVVVQTPIYPPFINSVRAAGRRLIDQPLLGDSIDLVAFEQMLQRERPKLLLLCNPHNPTGRVFTRTELARLAGLIVEHKLLVVSDEIHADLIYDGRRHQPFAMLGAGIAARTITLNSASKAFNIAGLRTAVCVVSNALLRRRLQKLPPHRWSAYSSLGVRATRVAWTADGEKWLQACVSHLQAMRDLLVERLPKALPGLSWSPPQATYLAWLDCRGLALDSQPHNFFLEHAKVALSPGPDFGLPGTGHVRLNFATSEEILSALINRLGTAYARHQQRRLP